MTFNWNPNNKKTILAIDGGGMRGVISLGMLAELEALTGKPAYELFDMVAGTSTGAIIAAGLCAKMNASQILEVYLGGLRNSFDKRDFAFWVRFVFAHGMRYMYDSERIRKVLQPMVEGMKVKDCQKPSILLTTKDVRNGNNYFMVSKGSGAAAFGDYPLSGAVAASASAPIYFPVVAGNLIDGGVGVYGNPCLAAAIEAMEYIGASEGYTDGNVILVSLGTGYPPSVYQDGEAARFWLLDWLGYIIGENIDDSGLQQAFTTRAIYNKRIDFRRYNPMLTNGNVQTVLGIDLPAGTNVGLFGLDTVDLTELQIMERIGREYAKKLDWLREDIMPWNTVGGHQKPDVDFMKVDWSKTNYR
jgi:uncharacterized protein